MKLLLVFVILSGTVLGQSPTPQPAPPAPPLPYLVASPTPGKVAPATPKK